MGGGEVEVAVLYIPSKLVCRYCLRAVLASFRWFAGGGGGQARQGGDIKSPKPKPDHPAFPPRTVKNTNIFNDVFCKESVFLEKYHLLVIAENVNFF